MTVYVDDMFLRADVPNGARTVRGKWCHLFSDSLDPTELHAMARRIGMRTSWFQHKPRAPWQDHYDVTMSMRARAVKAGAREVKYDGGQSAEIMRVKRCQFLGIDPDEDKARCDEQARKRRAEHGVPERTSDPERNQRIAGAAGRLVTELEWIAAQHDLNRSTGRAGAIVQVARSLPGLNARQLCLVADYLGATKDRHHMVWGIAAQVVTRARRKEREAQPQPPLSNRVLSSEPPQEQDHSSKVRALPGLEPPDDVERHTGQLLGGA